MYALPHGSPFLYMKFFYFYFSMTNMTLGWYS